jgi:predicted XRE-type DNA-binding protein
MIGSEGLTVYQSSAPIVIRQGGIFQEKTISIKGEIEFNMTKLFHQNKLLLLESCEHRCSMCGKKTNQIHHLDKNRNNNEITNLIVTCSGCHKLIFHSIKKPDFNNPVLKLLMIAHIPRKKIIQLTGISSSRISDIIRGKITKEQRKAFFNAFGIDTWEWDEK